MKSSSLVILGVAFVCLGVFAIGMDLDGCPEMETLQTSYTGTFVVDWNDSIQRAVAPGRCAEKYMEGGGTEVITFFTSTTKSENIYQKDCTDVEGMEPAKISSDAYCRSITQGTVDQLGAKYTIDSYNRVVHRGNQVYESFTCETDAATTKTCDLERIKQVSSCRFSVIDMSKVENPPRFYFPDYSYTNDSSQALCYPANLGEVDTFTTVDGVQIDYVGFNPDGWNALVATISAGGVILAGAAGGGIYAQRRRSKRKAAKAAESPMVKTQTDNLESGIGATAAVETDKPGPRRTSGSSRASKASGGSKRKSTASAGGSKRRSSGGSKRRSSGGSKRRSSGGSNRKVSSGSQA